MTMRKDINDYSLYVFDLDGTLYDQPRLRMIMAKRLLAYYICHPFSARDLILLSHFRKVKDHWKDSSSEEDIIRKTAEDKNTTADRVGRIVKKWIYDDPLSALAKTRDDKLIGWITKLRGAGRKVVVWSDYPTSDKLKALGVTADAEYSPEDKRISALKPSPEGLNIIMKDMDIACEDVLMIGDRQEKDGEAAAAANVDCIILERKVKKRGDYGIQA